MDVTRKLCFACVLFTLVNGRIIYSKKNKVKKSQKEEQWLVDSVSLSPQSWPGPEGVGHRGPDPPPPLKNYKNIGPKLPSQHSMLGHHRSASETPFHGVSLAGQDGPFI